MNGSAWQRELRADVDAGVVDDAPPGWYGGDEREPDDEAPFVVESLRQLEERLNRLEDQAA